MGAMKNPGQKARRRPNKPMELPELISADVAAFRRLVDDGHRVIRYRDAVTLRCVQEPDPKEGRVLAQPTGFGGWKVDEFAGTRREETIYSQDRLVIVAAWNAYWMAPERITDDATVRPQLFRVLNDDGIGYMVVDDLVDMPSQGSVVQIHSTTSGSYLSPRVETGAAEATGRFVRIDAIDVNLFAMKVSDVEVKPVYEPGRITVRFEPEESWRPGP